MARYPGGGRGLPAPPAQQVQRMEFASPQQEEIFRYGPAPLCASGGQGGGKTLGLTRKALLLSDLFPGNRGVIIRKVWDELKKTTMQTFFKDCPPEAYQRGGRRADQDKILRFNPRRCADGVTRSSEILWLYLDDPNVETMLRGLEINWFIIDQAEEIEEENFDFLMGRMGRWDRAFVPADVIMKERAAGREWKWWNKATGRPLPPTYAMLTCSPDTELHWIWRRFHEESPEWQEHWRALGYKMVHFDSRQNKFLTQQNLEHLLNQGEAFVRRFVAGEWGMPEGRIHTVPNDSIIEGSPEVFQWIMDNCRHFYRILDHGDTSPTCCMWMAVTEGGDCIFYREYYKPDALVSDHRYAIRELSNRDGQWSRRYTDLCDPSMLLKTMQRLGGRYTIGDEYTDCSVMPRDTAIFWQPADNNELGTRNRINEYLRVHPTHRHPIRREQMGAPYVYFVRATPDYPDGCNFIIRETRSQRRKKVGSEQGRPIFGEDRDDTITDHAYDCLRYALAGRGPISGPTVEHRSDRWTAADTNAWLDQRKAKKLWTPVPLPPVRRIM